LFEFDWKNSKITKILKNFEDQDPLKQYMRGIYSKLRKVYKFYSSINPVGEVWSIS